MDPVFYCFVELKFLTVYSRIHGISGYENWVYVESLRKVILETELVYRDQIRAWGFLILPMVLDTGLVYHDISNHKFTLFKV